MAERSDNQLEKTMWAKRGAERAGKSNLDFVLVIGMLLGWFLLQAIVLPRMGVST